MSAKSAATVRIDRRLASDVEEPHRAARAREDDDANVMTTVKGRKS